MKFRFQSKDAVSLISILVKTLRRLQKLIAMIKLQFLYTFKLDSYFSLINGKQNMRSYILHATPQVTYDKRGQEPQVHFFQKLRSDLFSGKLQ